MSAARRIVRFCACLIGFGLILPAMAQDQAAQPSNPGDIVVVGSQDQERERQIRDFVHGMTATPGTDPLARLDIGQMCPRAVGLGAGYDQAITNRLRRVAASARIDLAKETCRYPNALVIFTSDKAATITLLRKRYPWLFRDRSGDPIVPEKQTGLTTIWHVEAMVNGDGVPIRPQGRGGITVSRTTRAASRLTVLARPVFLMSIAVIERRAVDGLTMNQIADYSAMRLYSEADPARAKETGAPTILTVLETPPGGKAPGSMTVWDLAFLRGLYKSWSNSHASAQRGEIGDYMKRTLKKDENGKR